MNKLFNVVTSTKSTANRDVKQEDSKQQDSKQHEGFEKSSTFSSTYANAYANIRRPSLRSSTQQTSTTAPDPINKCDTTSSIPPINTFNSSLPNSTNSLSNALPKVVDISISRSNSSNSSAPTSVPMPSIRRDSRLLPLSTGTSNQLTYSKSVEFAFTAESPIEKSARLRSFTTPNISSIKVHKQHDYILLLPDPTCVINSSGQIGFSNEPFQRTFRNILPRSMSIFDIVGASIIDQIRDGITEGLTSLFPLIKQYVSIDEHTINGFPMTRVNGSETFVWTLSTQGGPNMSDSSQYCFLVMYSRPTINSELHTLSHEKTVTQTLAPVPLKPLNEIASEELSRDASPLDAAAISAFDSNDQLDRLSQTLIISEDEKGVEKRDEKGVEKVDGALLLDSSIAQPPQASLSPTYPSSQRVAGLSPGTHGVHRTSSQSLLLPMSITSEDEQGVSDRFTRRFTHELRTPLHIILNHLSCIDQQRASMEMTEIKGCTLEIKSILDDYAFLSQIGDTQLLPSHLQSVHTLTDAVVSLSDFIQSIAYSATAQIRFDRTFEFNFNNCDDNVCVKKLYIERIFAHLFMNSAKFSSCPSVITCECIATPTANANVCDYQFNISNTCLPNFNVLDIVSSLNASLASVQTYINKKESQNSLAATSGNLAHSHGLGFGLSVASHMIRCLDGQLSCSCDEVNNTVVFSFTIPLERASKSGATSHDSDERWGSVDSASSDITIAPPEVDQSLSRSAGSVLVVDDSLVCRKLMVMKLTDDGFVTEVAVNGLEACQIIEANMGVFDAILLDLHMPVMDGIAATKYIRTTLGSNIPILVLSAEQGDTKAEAIRNGANGFMDKPAIAKDVIAKLRPLIAEYRKSSPQQQFQALELLGDAE